MWGRGMSSYIPGGVRAATLSAFITLLLILSLSQTLDSPHADRPEYCTSPQRDSEEWMDLIAHRRPAKEIQHRKRYVVEEDRIFRPTGHLLRMDIRR
jgi:hypothetical protein